MAENCPIYFRKKNIMSVPRSPRHVLVKIKVKEAKNAKIVFFRGMTLPHSGYIIYFTTIFQFRGGYDWCASHCSFLYIHMKIDLYNQLQKIPPGGSVDFSNVQYRWYINSQGE